MLVYLKPDRTESKLNLWFDYIRSEKWHTSEIGTFEKGAEERQDFAHQYQKKTFYQKK